MWLQGPGGHSRTLPAWAERRWFFHLRSNLVESPGVRRGLDCPVSWQLELLTNDTDFLSGYHQFCLPALWGNSRKGNDLRLFCKLLRALSKSVGIYPPFLFPSGIPHSNPGGCGTQESSQASARHVSLGAHCSHFLPLPLGHTREAERRTNSRNEQTNKKLT